MPLTKPINHFFPTEPRSLDQINPTLRKVLRDLINGERPWPLFLSGGVGVGKTAAALCLLDHCGGEYFTVETLAEAFIAAQHGRYERGEGSDRRTVYTEGLWFALQRARLIVLDEIGTTDQTSDYRYNVAKRLIDLRIGKPLVVISNFNLPALATLYDDRVLSRLASGTTFHLTGPDRRLPLPVNGAGQERRNGQKAGH